MDIKDNNEIEWREPVEGYEFAVDSVVVTEQYQLEKLQACGLSASAYQGHVDASFYIALGIRAGINSGISAQGNVNMLQNLVQHRPVKLGETLTVRGYIKKVTEVPRGLTVDTEVWFEGEDGSRAISAPRRSLKPDPNKIGSRGAGEKPAPVFDSLDDTSDLGAYQLDEYKVKEYSTEGNSIHYEMDAANKAGFRAPIIGGGMGVHYLVNAIWQAHEPQAFDLAIYFRRPIFWDDGFRVRLAAGINDEWQALCLEKNGKVLTEARIEHLIAQSK